MLGIDAGTSIADGDADLWTMMVLPRRVENVQTQCSSVGHGLNRVSNEIEKYLF